MKTVYVIMDYAYANNDYDLGDSTDVLGVVSTIDKANEFIRTFKFIGPIIEDTCKPDESDNNWLTREVTMAGDEYGHEWTHILYILESNLMD